VIILYNSTVIKHSSKKKPWKLFLLQHDIAVFFIKLHKSSFLTPSYSSMQALSSPQFRETRKEHIFQSHSHEHSSSFNIFFYELFSSCSSFCSTAFCSVTCLKCGNKQALMLTFSIILNLFQNSQRSLLIHAFWIVTSDDQITGSRIPAENA